MTSWKTGAAALLILAPVAALAQDDLTKQIVNDPSAPQGNGVKASLYDDSGAEGGKALRVQVPKKGANPWDSTLNSSIVKPIKKGDHLVLLFSAKLEKGENGATTTTLPYNAIQLDAGPYTTVISDTAKIGPQWKDFKVTGVSAASYPAKALKVTIQLATAKQTVDFGPIVVLDQGQ